MVSEIDRWRSWVALLRSWGRTVVECDPSPWGRDNGESYNDPAGPVGWINHHFVCSLNPDPDYIAGIVAMLVNGYDEGNGSHLPGPVVPTFVDVHGTVYLIATGSANHAGQGSSAVLSRVKRDLPPQGSAASLGLADDGVKNEDYAGTETQHPGDSTPYPQPLIDALVDVNAAAAIVWGWSDAGARSIQHYESTARKDDMSWHGGPTGTGGPDLRALVAARIAAYRSGDDDVALSDDDKAWLTAQFAAVVKDALTNPKTVGVVVLDAAATPNSSVQSIVQALGRDVRLDGLTVTGQTVPVHPGPASPPPAKPAPKAKAAKASSSPAAAAAAEHNPFMSPAT